ncbi:hypothetical protein JCM8097_002187 [Rhodosporidiobolus ruineniae]
MARSPKVHKAGTTIEEKNKHNKQQVKAVRKAKNGTGGKKKQASPLSKTDREMLHALGAARYNAYAAAGALETNFEMKRKGPAADEIKDEWRLRQKDAVKGGKVDADNVEDVTGSQIGSVIKPFLQDGRSYMAIRETVFLGSQKARTAYIAAKNSVTQDKIDSASLDQVDKGYEAISDDEDL